MEIVKMNKEYAEEIMTWKYNSPYEIYSFTASEEFLSELLDGTYYGVVEEKLMGYICYGKSAQVPPGASLGAYDSDCIDIGLGLKPELCGRGLGKDLIKLGIDFLYDKHNAKGIRLSVADFNKRAYSLYKRVGFKDKMRFYRKDELFLIMEYTR